jgi:hypothetical protein
MCVLNLSWPEYESLTTDLVKFVVSTATEILRNRLGDLLWKNASRDEAWRDISSPGASTDVAMTGLLQAGWTPERVGTVGGQLASFVADGLMRLLPKPW